jgi:hypothetical protein
MYRLWGLIPLMGVAWAAWDYARAGVLPELLWVCNAAAALVGAGWLAGSPRAVWTGTVGLVVALPLWLPWALSGRDEGWHALITHLVSPGLGLLALRRMARPADLVSGALLGLAGWVALSRLLTPRELDVNLAFQPLPVLLLALLGAGLALAGAAWVLQRLAPRPPADPLMLALDLGDARRQRAFFAHFDRAARRGPGDKRALKALLARIGER